MGEGVRERKGRARRRGESGGEGGRDFMPAVRLELRVLRPWVTDPGMAPITLTCSGIWSNVFSFLMIQGEAAAVKNTMEALMECIEKEEGCYVVPGIPSNQYQLTLICSVFGGFIAGYASRLEPQGKIQARFRVGSRVGSHIHSFHIFTNSLF